MFVKMFSVITFRDISTKFVKSVSNNKKGEWLPICRVFKGMVLFLYFDFVCVFVYIYVCPPCAFLVLIEARGPDQVW